MLQLECCVCGIVGAKTISAPEPIDLLFTNIKARITKLSRPRFSKTLVLVRSRVYKYRPGINIIEH